MPPPPPSCRAPLALAAALLWALPARVSGTQQLVTGLTPFDPYGILTLTMRTPGDPSIFWSQVVYLTEWRPPLSGVGSWVEAQRVAMPSAGIPNPDPVPLTFQGLGLGTPAREGIGTTSMDGQTAVFVGYGSPKQVTLPQGINVRSVATVRPDGSVLLTQATVTAQTVTRGAAAVNGSAGVYFTTDTALKFLDLTAAPPSTVTVASFSRPYQPLFAGQGGGAFHFYTMGWSGSTGPSCNCNGLYGSSEPPPTAPVLLTYQPSTDRGGGAAPQQGSNQAGWFRSATEYYACDNFRNELAAFNRVGATWTWSWSAPAVGVLWPGPCYSVAGRVEGGHTMLYVVVGGATEKDNNVVHRINATSRNDDIVFGSVPFETFRSAFFSPCSSAVQGALGLPCPLWQDGVAYMQNVSSGGVPGPSPTATISVTPSASATPSNTPTTSLSPSASATPSTTPSTSASQSLTPSTTVSGSVSRSATLTPTTPGTPAATPSSSWPPNTSRSPSASQTCRACRVIAGSPASSMGSSESSGIVGGIIGGIILVCVTCLFFKRWAEQKGNAAHRQRRGPCAGVSDMLFGVTSPVVASNFAPTEHPIFSAIAAQQRSTANAPYGVVSGSGSRSGGGGDGDDDDDNDDGVDVRAVPAMAPIVVRHSTPAAGGGGGFGGGGGGARKFGGGSGGSPKAGSSRALAGSAATLTRQPSSMMAPMSGARAAAFARAASGALDPKAEPAFVPVEAPAPTPLAGRGAFGNRSLTAKAPAPPLLVASRRFEVAPLSTAGAGGGGASAASKARILSGASV